MKEFERQVRWMHDLARKRVQAQRGEAIEIERQECARCNLRPHCEDHTCVAPIAKINDACAGQLKQLDDILEAVLTKSLRARENWFEEGRQTGLEQAALAVYPHDLYANAIRALKEKL